jgi:hypothetical protein
MGDNDNRPTDENKREKENEKNHKKNQANPKHERRPYLRLHPHRCRGSGCRCDVRTGVLEAAVATAVLASVLCRIPVLLRAKSRTTAPACDAAGHGGGTGNAKEYIRHCEPLTWQELRILHYLTHEAIKNIHAQENGGKGQLTVCIR